jgi:hypothetical protein
MLSRMKRACARSPVLFLLTVFATASIAVGQGPPDPNGVVSRVDESRPSTAVTAPAVNTNLSLYFDPLEGHSSEDLVRRAVTSNTELAAARLEIERGRARLTQSSSSRRQAD